MNRKDFIKNIALIGAAASISPIALTKAIHTLTTNSDQVYLSGNCVYAPTGLYNVFVENGLCMYSCGYVIPNGNKDIALIEITNGIPTTIKVEKL